MERKREATRLATGARLAIFFAGMLLAYESFTYHLAAGAAPLLLNATYNHGYSGVNRVAVKASAKIIDRAADGLSDEDAASIRAALELDPLNRSLLRSLSVYHDINGRPDDAYRIMKLTDAVSRRDFINQMWLAEYYIQNNRPQNGLSHFGNVLLVRPAAAAVVFPRLLKVAMDPDLRASMIRSSIFSEGWFPEFYRYLIAKDMKLASTITIARSRDFISPKWTNDVVDLMQRLTISGESERMKLVFNSVFSGIDYANYNALGRMSSHPDKALNWLDWQVPDTDSLQLNNLPRKQIEIEISPGFEGTIVQRRFNVAGSSETLVSLSVLDYEGIDLNQLRLNISCEFEKGLSPFQNLFAVSESDKPTFRVKGYLPDGCNQIKMDFLLDKPAGLTGGSVKLGVS